jgi:chromate transporter
MKSPGQAVSGASTPQRRIAPWTIFLEFARLAMMGFGGVLPFVRHSLVERNKWIDDREFAEVLSIGQILPGANIVNLSVMLGWRFGGPAGALAGFSGLLLVPSILLLAIASVYDEVGHYAPVRRALMGMAAVAAGLVLATGLKLAAAQPRTARALLVGAAAFVMMALLHCPLALLIAIMAPLALLWEWLATE